MFVKILWRCLFQVIRRQVLEIMPKVASNSHVQPVTVPRSLFTAFVTAFYVKAMALVMPSLLLHTHFLLSANQTKRWGKVRSSAAERNGSESNRYNKEDTKSYKNCLLPECILIINGLASLWQLSYSLTRFQERLPADDDSEFCTELCLRNAITLEKWSCLEKSLELICICQQTAHD